MKLQLNHRFFKKIILFLVFTLGGGFLFLDFHLDLDTSRVVVDRKGKLLSIELTGDDKFRYWQKLGEVETTYRDFILEKEDRYFFYHPGVNPVSLASATFDYLITGKNKGGASTITMQLARLYYRLNTRSPMGKIKQIFAAFWLELTMQKDSILEAYLNLIPMGKNIEGFETASLYYFRKSGGELTRDEFNFLTLLPQRPYLIRSFQRKRWKDFKVGWKLLYPQLSFKESSQLLKNLRIYHKRPFFAPHATRKVLAKSERKKIVTTLDLEWQNQLEQILALYIKNQNSVGIFNAASLVIDTESAEIISYIGSANFYNHEIHGQVDGLTSKRSPGSTLKPFIYGLSFQNGLYHPKSILFDSPLPYRTPENYDRRYRGPLTLEEALITSRNIPAVFVNNELQRNKDGIYSLLDFVYPLSKGRGYYGSSIALGALEVNAWQLGELYTALANNGEFKNLVLEQGTLRNSIPILSEEASVMVKDILKENPRPRYQNSQAFSQQNGEVYWKTGTSFGFRDAWAVGIWQKYAIVTWVGDFTSKSNPYLVGSISAAPLFFQFIDFLRSENKSLKDFDLKHLYHKNLTEVDVCSVSGHLPNEDCSVTTKTVFWPGKSPIKKCDIHKKITVAKESGLRVCPKYSGQTQLKVFEFFSSETKDLYLDYGIELKLPPDFHPVCENQIVSQNLGDAPEIISPKRGFTYLREQGELALIPLQARASVSSKELSWYLEDRLLGKSQPGALFTVNLAQGNYLLRVIDDSGRMSRRVVRVK